MTPLPLRPYQERAIVELREAFLAGQRRAILKLPTGAGKTRVAAELISSALAKGRSVAFLVPRVSLIPQTLEAFRRNGIDHVGVMQPNYVPDPSAPVQIVSGRTLARREAPNAGLIIVDEAHLRDRHVAGLLEAGKWASVPAVGLSATPWAKGMGGLWKGIVAPVSIGELIEQGHLAPFRVLAPQPPDLAGVRIGQDGDYATGQLSELMRGPEIVGDVIRTWQSHGADRPTLVYAVDRKHAQHLQLRFLEIGARAEYLDGETQLFDRDEIFARFRRGDTRVICSVAAIDTGVDLPETACIVDARPTRSRIRFVQTIGRGLRTAPGKDCCLILDHAGNHLRLGTVIEVDSCELDDGKAPGRAYDKRKSDAPKLRLCPSCACVQAPGARACPQCGHVFPVTAMVQEREGDLVELGARSTKSAVGTDQRQFYAMILAHAHARGFSKGWAAHSFREKFKTWPPFRYVAPEEPDEKTLNWIRSRQIARAKARGGVRRAG